MDATPDSTATSGTPDGPFSAASAPAGQVDTEVRDVPGGSTASAGPGSPIPPDQRGAPAEGEFAALSPKVLTLWRWVWGTVAAAIIAIAAFIGVVAVDLPVVARVAIPVIVGIIAVALVSRVTAAAYKRWRYRVTDDGLDVDHGLIIHQQSSIPHFRVQHVDIRRGLIQRQLGIVSITINTASPATDAQLPGLDPEQAETIRRRVLDRAEADDGV